jgi:hypothetical protein
MVQALAAAGDLSDALREITPMVNRVVAANGFWEWWDNAGHPEGSAHYRGAAGELGLAAEQLLANARR